MAGIASSSSSSSEDLTQKEMAPGAAVDSVDALLQRRKCELMYELKKIQHGERPVTGSDSRGKVDSFFSKRVQLQESHTPVSNVDEVEEHRPQQVTIEVQGLLQSRSVSSMLQSERFRRSLENAVRSHLAGPAGNNRTPSARPRTETTHRTAPPAVSTPSSIPAPPPNGPPVFDNEPEADQNTSRSQAEPLIPQQSSIRAEEVMRRWNQEDFVMEISELVHRQLVSNTLRGDFRDRLERHVGRRVADAGVDGQRVQQQILQLPPSRIVHNDFSHLGIPSVQDQQQQQIDDAVSVISATASATIPYAQSNAAVQREMSAMKAQIAQLSNMLKMSLDLQMDIQRSIRQEVAAAVGQASNSNAGTEARATPQLHSERADDSKCIICLDEGADAVLYRCGHLCMCYSCALRMRGASGTCPVCRAPITDILRAYRISHEQ